MSTPADQIDVNGVIAAETDAQVQAQFSGKTITPTTTFAFSWNGSIINYQQNVTAVVDDPALLVALTAAGAPFTQP
jgi:hypothetical protein